MSEEEDFGFDNGSSTLGWVWDFFTFDAFLLLLCGRSSENLQLPVYSLGVIFQEKKRPEKEVWGRMGSGHRRVGRDRGGHRRGAGEGGLRYNFGEQERGETVEGKEQH